MEVPSSDGDWRERSRVIHLAILDGLLRHPDSVDLAVWRARYGTAGVGLFERILSTLRETGLDARSDVVIEGIAARLGS